MSNLLKYPQIVCKEDKRVIDYNETIKNKLMEIRKVMTEDASSGEEFTLGLDARNVNILLEEGETKVDTESGIGNEELSVKAESIIQEAERKAKEIIETAKSDAEHIVEDALSQAENLKQKAKIEGIEQGVAQAEEQINEEKAMLLKEFEDRQISLENEYAEKIKRIEPELVDVILELFVDITKVLSFDKRDMIMTLVDSVISGDEISNNIIIRVSKDDAAFLRENKERIIASTGKDIHLEIVEDMMMKKNECCIDTDFGIYDCSLDIQLENLVNDIKILSSVV